MKERRTREGQSVAPSATLEEARAYEEHALRELRSAGYRITMPRVQVIRALADTSKALSAYAIHEKIINSGGKIDVVSVYRILSTLQEVGLIHHIGIVDGYFPCRLTDCQGRHSEVVVCEKCNSVMELLIPQSIVDTIQEQSQKNHFTMTGVKVEVTSSNCPHCDGK